MNNNCDNQVSPNLQEGVWQVEDHYIAVPGAYQYREILRKEGFIWNGYGYKNAWIKKILSTEYHKVLDFLREQRLAGKRVPELKK